MNGRDFKKARKALGFEDANEFAEFFGIGSGRTVRRWEADEKDIPEPVIMLVEVCIQFPQVFEWLAKSIAWGEIVDEGE